MLPSESTWKYYNRKILVEIVHLNISDLKLLKNNPRKISKDQMDKLCESLKNDPDFFINRPCLVNEKDDVLEVYAGNQRVRAAKKLKWKKVPCIIEKDLSEHIVKERIIKDNKTYGEFDYEILANEWDVDLLLDAGFTPEELVGSAQDITDLGSTEEDESNILEPSKDEDAITKLGDVYDLGPHRIICGDSTLPEYVEKCLQEKKIEITFTSPPYNLGKSIKLSGNKKKNKDDTPYDKYHDNDDSEWLSLISSSLLQAQHKTQYQIFNIQVLAGNKFRFIEWLYAFKDHFVDLFVWQKHAAPVIAEHVMNSQVEMVIIFSSEKMPSRSIKTSTFGRGQFPNFYAGTSASSNEFSEKHAATMPLNFCLHMVKNFCSESVYDPFLGSGTTLIAAEQLGRICYGVELSPAYCDIIVNRWKNYMIKNNKAFIIKKNGVVFDG